MTLAAVIICMLISAMPAKAETGAEYVSHAPIAAFSGGKVADSWSDYWFITGSVGGNATDPVTHAPIYGCYDPDGDQLTYYWDFGDGTSASARPNTTDTSVHHTYTESGTFPVTLTVTDPTGHHDTKTWVNNVVVRPNRAPIADFDIGVGSKDRALSVDVDGFASSDPDGDALSYAWNFGDTSTSTGHASAHTYKAGGKQTVTLTVTDAKGLSTSVSKSVTTNSPTPESTSGSTVVDQREIVCKGLIAKVQGRCGAASLRGGLNRLKKRTGQAQLKVAIDSGGHSLKSIDVWMPARINTKLTRVARRSAKRSIGTIKLFGARSETIKLKAPRRLRGRIVVGRGGSATVSLRRARKKTALTLQFRRTGVTKVQISFGSRKATFVQLKRKRGRVGAVNGVSADLVSSGTRVPVNSGNTK